MATSERLEEIEQSVDFGHHVSSEESRDIFYKFIEEIRAVRDELIALRNENVALRAKVEAAYTVPDGYRVMLIHESE